MCSMPTSHTSKTLHAGRYTLTLTTRTGGKKHSTSESITIT